MADLTSAVDPNAPIKYTVHQDVTSGNLTVLPQGTQIITLPGIVEAGARHSAADSQHLQDAHDSLVKAGAMCNSATPAAESADRWPASPAVLQEVESVLTAQELVPLRESTFATIEEGVDFPSNTLT